MTEIKLNKAVNIPANFRKKGCYCFIIIRFLSAVLQLIDRFVYNTGSCRPDPVFPISIVRSFPFLRGYGSGAPVKGGSPPEPFQSYPVLSSRSSQASGEAAARRETSREGVRGMFFPRCGRPRLPFPIPRLLIKEGTGAETQTHPGVERGKRRERGQTRTAGEGLKPFRGGAGGEEPPAKRA